jgi:hypothetical protein
MKNNPWPKHIIQQRFPSRANIRYLKKVIDGAQDEKPIQMTLVDTPSLLRCLTLNALDCWYFDRPSLGGDYIPDFLLCCRTSAGFEWSYVELESPTKTPLLKSGLASAKLREAIGQIDDWRIWLRSNIAYAQNHLGLIDIDAECRGWIIIGRRSMIRTEHALKYRELSRNNLTVISYDRFLEMNNV